MNKELLYYAIRRKGLTKAQVAEYLGIDRATFSVKCNGHREFKQSEIQSLIKYLDITDPVPIFFAEEVS